MPQKAVSFDVNVAQGFCDLTVTQVYENNQTNPLEIVFKMPVSDSFAISSIQARFLLADGTESVLQTKVVERETAKAKYEDSVASGKTAVMATLPHDNDKLSANIMTIYLGNFPP
jgi:hypothetical protein